MKESGLSLPEFFDPANARHAGYQSRPVSRLRKEADIWAGKYRLQGTSNEARRIHLLVIDTQFDFSFPEGALYVAGRSGTGGMDANRNVATFIYRNLDLISEISCTLDTHDALQVFFPAAHLDRNDEHPAPHTVVSAEDYERGRYRPSPILAKRLGVDLDWLTRQFTYYCRQLEASRKHQLYLWPYHCLAGTDGHRLAGIVEEAVLFHGLVRSVRNRFETKGSNPLSESYSALQEEVVTTWEGNPLPGLESHAELLGRLIEAEAIMVAGLASSHCVRETVSDLIRTDAALARRLYILDDCTAPVVVAGHDFTEETKLAFADFQQAGVHVVSSTGIRELLELPAAPGRGTE